MLPGEFLIFASKTSSRNGTITDKVGFGRSQEQASPEPVLLAFTHEPVNIE